MLSSNRAIYRLSPSRRDEAQMLGAPLGRLRIVKVALDAPQPGRIRRVGQ
ncbi:MAG: hypothetical protein JO320_21915 [Alphaproteobacteria bacterium]|nr:hypothetical protein [Alphaproteobacteria bacterium]